MDKFVFNVAWVFPIVNLLAVILLILVWNQTQVEPEWRVQRHLMRWFSMVERVLNGGQYVHGVLAWLVAVLLPALGSLVLYRLAMAMHPLLALCFLVLVLWGLLAVKSLVRQADAMTTALMQQNVVVARTMFAQWFQLDVRRYTLVLLTKRAIELGVLVLHRQLLAPMFWFILLGLFGLGPAPVVLYVLSEHVSSQWRVQGVFAEFAQTIFDRLNAWPSMATAFGVAMVGDFEDALFAWRTQADQWPNKHEGVVLASCAGALGVKLGDAFPSQGVLVQRSELGVGDEAEAHHWLSAVGLLRRVFVLWVVVLLMLTVAYWLGT